jgi:hypothetical protein
MLPSGGSVHPAAAMVLARRRIYTAAGWGAAARAALDAVVRGFAIAPMPAESRMAP